MAHDSDYLTEGIGDTRQWVPPFNLRDKNGTIVFAVSSTGVVTQSGGYTSGALDVTGNFSVATNKFTVASASGNTVVAGTLGVTGAATLSSTLAVTGTSTLALVDISGIAAGSPGLKITATSDTPTVAFTDNGGASHAPTTAPAGYLEILVGASARYIPFWA